MSNTEERLANLEAALADLCSYYAYKHFGSDEFEAALKVVRETDPNKR